MNGRGTKEKVKYVFISALSFFIVTMPFRMLFSMFTISEIRPASALPPVFGLLWGPYGALGIAIGNFIADMLSGYGLKISVFGFIPQFLYGYLPYKLWHTFGVNNKNNIPNLSNIRNIIKYTIIVLIDSLMIAGFLGIQLDVMGVCKIKDLSTPFMLFNNFDFCILLGIPIIMFLPRILKEKYVPIKTEKNNKLKAIIVGGLLTIHIATFLGVFFYSLLVDDNFSIDGNYELLIICYIVTLISAYACPAKIGTFINKKQKYKLSVTEQVLVTFIIFIILSIFVIGVISYHENYGRYEMAILWNRVYITVGLSINVLFVLMLLFLRYAEKYITIPIESLSEITTRFAKSEHSKEENTELVKECEKIVCKNTEINMLLKSTVHMIGEVENYVSNIATITAEREHIFAELDVARQIQSSMLPKIEDKFADNGEFQLYATMCAAKVVGGDFYDFFFVDEKHIAIVIADVSGKGVPAAMFMAMAKTLIKNSFQTGLKPEEAMTVVNKQLCDGNDANMFVTSWVGLINTETGNVIYVNAGHNPPVIKRETGNFEYLRMRSGFVLAGFKKTKYKQQEIELDDGDCIYLYTDGITEANNINSELYGEERLLNVLNKSSHLEPEELLKAVRVDVDKFVGEAPQFDDMTMVSIKMKGGYVEKTFDAKTENVNEAFDFIEKILKNNDCTDKIIRNFKISIDELFSNVVKFSGSEKITVGCSVTKNRVSVRLIDNGLEYNPNQAETPDTSLAIEDRIPGGLGIFMVERLMDGFEYERRGESNIVIIRKKI